MFSSALVLCLVCSLKYNFNRLLVSRFSNKPVLGTYCPTPYTQAFPAHGLGYCNRLRSSEFASAGAEFPVSSAFEAIAGLLSVRPVVTRVYPDRPPDSDPGDPGVTLRAPGVTPA